MTYKITEARRYAKGKMLIQTVSDGTGMKTRADWLASALGRWVSRSKGYVMSPAAAAKFSMLYAAGFSAYQLFNDTPAEFHHVERGLEGLTAAQALKLC